MNSRERVIRAIEFEGPDRVPVTHSVLPDALLKYGEKLERIFRKYPSDFGYGYTYTKGQWLLSRKRKYVDEWGCLWVKIRRGLQVKEHPLADWEALRHTSSLSLQTLGGGTSVAPAASSLKGCSGCGASKTSWWTSSRSEEKPTS